MRSRSLALIVALVLLTGCNKPESTRVQVPDGGKGEAKADDTGKDAGKDRPAPTPPAGGTGVRADDKGKDTSKKRPAPRPPLSPDEAALYVERTRQLMDAVEKGRLSLVGELVKKGANVNDRDDDGQTALHRAAARGHKTMTVLLLALGADPAERDAKGRTPLLTAAQAGNAEVVKVLMTPSAVKDAAPDAIGRAFTNVKIDLGGLANRLEQGTRDALTQADNAGQTALMLAIAGGHADCVWALGLSGAYKERAPYFLRADKKGNNALHLAAAAGYAEVLHLLLDAHYHVLARDLCKLSQLRLAGPDGKTALELAEASGHKEAAGAIAAALMGAATAEDDLEAFRQLRAQYAAHIDPQRLFLWAAEAGGATVLRAIQEEYKDKPSREKLRLAGVGEDNTGYTALWCAVERGQPAVVDLLLDRKWWKDDEALIRFIECLSGSRNNPILNDEYCRKAQPRLIERVEKALAAARKKKDQKP
jgi:ankyrin repeat protein